MKVLWLASWYPDDYEPVNGDFIQRHAKAVSMFRSIDVIHVAQSGKDFAFLDKKDEHSSGNLREFIYYFPYKKKGIEVLDKVSYNLLFIKFYKQVVDDYIKQNGKPDLIHVHVPMKAGLVALYYKKKSGIPFIVSEHSSLYLKEAKDNFITRSNFFKRNTKKIFENALVVTNVSNAIGDVLKNVFAIKDLRIIPNVVDTKYFTYQQSSKGNSFRWLHVSSMMALKNVEGILGAMKQNIDAGFNCELVLCGPVSASIQQLAKTLKLDERITFTGEINYIDVATQMQQSDAFVLFSKHENFPCVVIEALCCGLPVVSSDVGGVKEAVNSTNGMLVQPNDVEALASAMLNVMKNISTYNKINIAKQAALQYSYPTVAKQFINLYKEQITLLQASIAH